MGCCSSVILDLKLKKYTDEVKPFKYNFTRVKCTAVHDGDTCHVVGIRNGEEMRVNIRLHGIDAPELKSDNPEEKKAAVFARDHLSSRILNKLLTIQFKGPDKYYGRELAILSDSKGEINKWMLTTRCAVPYDGGKKLPFDKNNFTS